MEENKKNEIRCSECGNEDLVFVTEYRKSILLRLLSVILLIIIIAELLMIGIEGFSESLFSVIPNFLASFFEKVKSKEGFLFLILAFIYSKFMNYALNQKPQVRAICKKCGKSWIID